MAQLTKVQKRQAQIDKARKAFESSKSSYPLAVNCRFEKQAQKIVVEFSNGVEFRFPPELAQGLADANDEQLSDIEIFPGGSALRWPILDVDLGIPQLMQGIYGSKSWMISLEKKDGC